MVKTAVFEAMMDSNLNYILVNLYTNVSIIKVCFCPQKWMSPPVPQTVVKGKKSI